MIGVDGAKTARNTNVLAIMLIHDTSDKIDKVVRSDEALVGEAAGALGLGRPCGAALASNSPFTGGEEEAAVWNGMAIASKVCERNTGDFILTELLALLDGWYSQESVDQVVRSDVTFLLINKTVNLGTASYT